MISIESKSWIERRKLFGGEITSPATIDSNPNPDLGKFAYSPVANFFIALLPHWLPASPINPCDIHLEFQLNRPEYCFLSKDDSVTDINFSIERAKIMVPEIKLADSLFLKIQSKLNSSAIRQYFNSTQINTFSIPKGTKKEEFDNICPGFNPSKLVVLIQTNRRYEGQFSKSCHKYSRTLLAPDGSNFLIKSVKCTLKGEDVDRINCDETVYSF